MCEKSLAAERLLRVTDLPLIAVKKPSFKNCVEFTNTKHNLHIYGLNHPCQPKFEKYFTLQIFSFPQISPVLHKFIYFHLFRHHTSFDQLNFSIYLFTLPVLHLILLFYFGEHLLWDCFLAHTPKRLFYFF